MSSNRKVLKILSLVQFVLSVCVVVLAVVAKVNGGGQTAETGDLIQSARPYLGLPASIVFGLLSAAGSVTGIRGANRPSALGKHFLICVLGAVLGIVAMVLAGADLVALLAPGATVAVDAAAAVFDSKVRKEIEARR